MGKTFKFDLGAKAVDTVTDVEGTITGRFEYLNGCIRYLLEFGKDGEAKDIVLDEDRLELVKNARREEPLRRTGGPRPAPSRPAPQR